LAKLRNVSNTEV